MKTIKLSALTAVITAAALLAPTAPALAEAPKSPFTPEVNALMATQDKLRQVAEKIDSGNGYAGVHLDAGTRTLNVYWKGKAPAKVHAAALTAKSKGLNVKVHQAKYAQAELRAEAARLVRENKSITGVAAKYDGSGIIVQQTAAMSTFSSVQSTFPLEVETADVAAAVASRYDDERDFKGGGYIENIFNREVVGACSSGFAVLDATGYDGFLTAAHCGEIGSYFSSGTTDYIGDVKTRSENWDTSLLGPTDAQPRVWIGDSVQPELTGTPAVQYGLDVVGATRTFPGEWLCTSGAFSGTVCEIRAEQVGMTITIPGFNHVYDTVMAFHHGGGAAAGNGDSGGPVFSAVDQKLTARGTLSAISTASQDVRTCYGVPASQTRTCSARIYFPDIMKQMEQHNVRIKTVS